MHRNPWAGGQDAFWTFVNTDDGDEATVEERACLPAMNAVHDALKCFNGDPAAEFLDEVEHGFQQGWMEAETEYNVRPRLWTNATAAHGEHSMKNFQVYDAAREIGRAVFFACNNEQLKDKDFALVRRIVRRATHDIVNGDRKADWDDVEQGFRDGWDKAVGFQEFLIGAA